MILNSYSNICIELNCYNNSSLFIVRKRSHEISFIAKWKQSYENSTISTYRNAHKTSLFSVVPNPFLPSKCYVEALYTLRFLVRPKGYFIFGSSGVKIMHLSLYAIPAFVFFLTIPLSVADFEQKRRAFAFRIYEPGLQFILQKV